MKFDKPILLIDQDDVMVEYIKGLTAMYNEKFEKNFDYTKCNNWNLVTIYGEEILEVMHEPELFLKLEPVKDALLVLERLFKSELFDIFIVTAANPRVVEAKVKWVSEHMPYFPTQHIIVCSVKYMIRGDYLLDDGIHNIDEFKKAGGTPIIFNRPHNKEMEREGIKRVDTWIEFEKWIMKEYENKWKKITNYKLRQRKES